jgi:hypothetical protein
VVDGDEFERIRTETQQAADAIFAMHHQPYVTATCRWCGHPVGQTLKSGQRWAHVARDGCAGISGSIGCRAASFDRLDWKWDDSLDRRWTAAPVRGSEVWT